MAKGMLMLITMCQSPALWTRASRARGGAVSPRKEQMSSLQGHFHLSSPVVQAARLTREKTSRQWNGSGDSFPLSHTWGWGRPDSKEVPWGCVGSILGPPTGAHGLWALGSGFQLCTIRGEESTRLFWEVQMSPQASMLKGQNQGQVEFETHRRNLVCNFVFQEQIQSNLRTLQAS